MAVFTSATTGTTFCRFAITQALSGVVSLRMDDSSAAAKVSSQTITPDSVLSLSERGSKLCVPISATLPSITIDFACRPRRTPGLVSGTVSRRARNASRPNVPEAPTRTGSVAAVGAPRPGNGLYSWISKPSSRRYLRLCLCEIA